MPVEQLEGVEVVGNRSDGGSNTLQDIQEIFDNGTMIPNYALSFAESKAGKVMIMGGSYVYQASSYAAQRNLAAELAAANKYVGSASRLLGWVGGGFVLANDGIGVYNYYKYGPNSPNAVSPWKTAVDGTAIGIGIYGGWPGAIGSGVYFLISPAIWFQPGPMIGPISPVDNMYVAPPK